MVRILIDLRRSLATHQLAGAAPAAVAATVALAALSAVGTLVAGSITDAREGTTTDVLALLVGLWVAGRLAPAALSGEPFLRPELIALLPIPRRRLARSLFGGRLLDPANLFIAIASAAMLAYGVRLGPAATVTALGAVLLTVAVTSVLATVAAGLLGPGSRRGHDAGTVLTAVFISLLALTGTLLPGLLSDLRRGGAQGLAELLRLLPSGWGPVAVAPARRRRRPAHSAAGVGRPRRPSAPSPHSPGRQNSPAGCRVGTPSQRPGRTAAALPGGRFDARRRRRGEGASPVEPRPAPAHLPADRVRGRHRCGGPAADRLRPRPAAAVRRRHRRGHLRRLCLATCMATTVPACG